MRAFALAAADATPVTHLRQTLGHGLRLRLRLSHFDTIATAAARGSPPAGMSSGEPSATDLRGRLAPNPVSGHSSVLLLLFINRCLAVRPASARVF